MRSTMKPHRGPVHRPAHFTLDGTDHASHKEQGSMIRRYIIWRHRHADDQRLCAVVDRANDA
ncbi:ATP11 family protein [Streptomyces sp. TRM76130]|nr:ATP11 family protein [Streptomyces sp. TRM76130]